jgi:prepilin-type N-terminal cleavage/methylation domain-containing protein
MEQLIKNRDGIIIIKQNKAFTILELLLVLTIMAILSGLALPPINNYQQTIKLKASVEQLVSDLRYVQQKSIITASQHGIVFDLPNNCYYLIKDKDNPQVLRKITLQEVELKNSNLPRYNRLHFSGQMVFFKELGNLDHRNGRVELKLNQVDKQIVFSSNAGEINIR